MQKTLFWMAYGIATIAATAHTFQVFLMSDPPWLAFVAAVGVDMLLAYCLYSLGEQTGNQRTAGVIGIIALASISGMAQIVQRFNGLSVGLLPWMQWASLFLVPISTTGGLVLLGVVRYFQSAGGNRQNLGKQQFQNQQRHQQNNQREQPRHDPRQPENGRERAPHPIEAPH